MIPPVAISQPWRSSQDSRSQLPQAAVFRVEVPHHGDPLDGPGDPLHSLKVRQELPAAAKEPGGGEGSGFAAGRRRGCPSRPGPAGPWRRARPRRAGSAGRPASARPPTGPRPGPAGPWAGRPAAPPPAPGPDVETQQRHGAEPLPVQHRPQQRIRQEPRHPSPAWAIRTPARAGLYRPERRAESTCPAIRWNG